MQMTTDCARGFRTRKKKGGTGVTYGNQADECANQDVEGSSDSDLSVGDSGEGNVQVDFGINVSLHLGGCTVNDGDNISDNGLNVVGCALL